MNPKIPNFNTFSTLVDRLSIENVKLAYFENAMEHDNPSEKEAGEYRKKIKVQKDAIEALKEELAGFMEEVFLSGRYEYLKEERTFK